MLKRGRKLNANRCTPFRSFKSRSGYVVHNLNKPFQYGHTHLTSAKACRDAIGYCIELRVPLKANIYYLTSLQRISTNVDYILKLEERKQYLLNGGER